ncbi:MAG TPA: type II secretion system ATPase GspE [Candidatus Binatia bacterium]|nr:type II secretion system ATPase GspE [Candidatus Binatia bacterium]
MVPVVRSVEDILIQEAGIPADILAKAKERLKNDKDLGEILRELGALDAATWAKAQALYYGLPYGDKVTLGEHAAELLARVPLAFAKHYQLLPLAQHDGAVTVAVVNPRELGALDDLRLLLGVPARPLVVPKPVLHEALNRAYDQASQSTQELLDTLDEKALDLDAAAWQEPRDLLEAQDEAPIIRLVNSLFYQASKERASDIHIEPFEQELVVRLRIDGILYDTLTPPKAIQPLLISRIKIMAGLNIAEKRLPQDGRIRLKVAGKDIDIRVSVIPTAFGERVVLRLLDRSSALLGMEELGLSGRNLTLVTRLIRQSHGIILVTGPTGSGKTTTLYAALSQINTSDKNIITIEDPIEYQLRGIGQMQVNPKIDLSFAAGLRSILRQDPDVIMIGEIRDAETAEIAIQAALTGHLVFSTLHTNDSFGAVSRLLDMGVEPYLVSSSLLGVMAQRLVRRVCQDCRQAYTPTEGEIRDIGLTPQAVQGRPFYRPGSGCETCHGKGYRGRNGIHELLIFTDTTRALVMQRADAAAIRRAAVESGMPTLRDDGAEKVLAGLTTVEEVVRVTQEEML